MVSLSITQLFQLYAPLAGLLVVTFYLGALSNRTKVSENRILKLETKVDGAATDAVHLGRLEERVDGVKISVDKMEREVHGIQRSLSNLVTGKAGSIQTFGQDPT